MAPIYSSSRPSALALAKLCFLGLFSLLQTAEARRWEDAIMVSIYAQSHVDIPRIQYSLEADPFNGAPVPTMPQSELLSDAPSSVPSYFADPESQQQQQNAGGSSSSNAMSDAVSQNCPSGESSYKVNKFDTWGDGWGETSISIREVNSNLIAVETTSEESTYTISKDVQMEDYTTGTTATATVSVNRTTQITNQTTTSGEQNSTRRLDSLYVGSLKSGDFDSQHVCLSHSACYEVTLQGGKWQEEAKWEIVPAASSDGDSQQQVAVAKGQGVSNCTFYVSDSVVDHPNCPFTCRASSLSLSSSSSVDNSTSIAKAAPPVPQSVIALTEEPTSAQSDAPSLVPTMM